MTEAGTNARSQRPPSSAVTRGQRNARQTGSSPTAELLRRRVAQAEAHLREMEEEANRVATQQSAELQIVQKDHDVFLQKLELLRMEECMTPAELDALRVGASTTTPPGKQEQAALDSKLLASTSAKYRAARDVAQRKRTECAEAEARLAAARNKLATYRTAQQQISRATQNSVYAATVHRTQVNQLQSQSREQLRGLEVHVAAEQERLSSLVTDAKQMRGDIDALLIAQSRFERTYRKREDELLEKKKQMSFIVEVCALLFEEREEKRREIVELQALSGEENKKYEVALEELDGVLAENRQAQAELDEKLSAARKELRETRKTRVGVQRSNEAAEADARRQREQSRRRQLSLMETSAASSTNDAGRHGQAGRRLNGVDGAAAEPSEAPSQDDLDDSAQRQIQQFDLFYGRLAELAGSDRLDDVVSYTDISAEERFRFFSELNYLVDETAKLQEEKRRLLGIAQSNEHDAGDGGDMPPSDAGGETGDGDGKDEEDLSAVGTKRAAAESALRRQRADQMKQLQGTLDRLTLQNVEEGEEAESLERVHSDLLAHIKQMFMALGCDSSVLREQSGVENVLRANVTHCLSLIDQRVEEYLLALARAEHDKQLQEHERQLILQDDSDDSGHHQQHQLLAMQQQQQKHSVARTFLRRPDLPPRIVRDSEEDNDRTAGEDLANATVSTGHDKHADSASLSAKQLVARARGGLPRSVEDHPVSTAAGGTKAASGSRHGIGGGGAAAAALSLPVTDVPLSLEEMQRIVRDRHGAATRTVGDTRRFQS